LRLPLARLVVGGLAALLAGCAAGSYQPDTVWRARVEALAAAWPVGHYTVSVAGQEVGTMTLRQSVVLRGEEPVLLLEDAARITLPDSDRSGDATWVVHCRLDDHFTPLEIELQEPTADGMRSSTLKLDAGRLHGTAFDARLDVPLPHRVALRQGLLRLVGLLPRQQGGEVRLAFLSLDAGLERHARVDVQRPVRCAGLDAVQLGDRPLPCWRFEYDSGPEGRTHVVSLWVGEDGRLLRFHDEQGLQLLARDD